MNMVNIPAGSFMMGSYKLTENPVEENRNSDLLDQASIPSICATPDPDATDAETPQHMVSICAFQMGKTAVTLRQFKRFIMATDNDKLMDDDFKKANAYGDDAPVVHISWNDAQAFIDWLNQAEGGGYRLPSEAEWEYACRAGDNHLYSGSDNIDAVAWYDNNSGKHLREVGGKQANAFGLYDMSGNVWEWVQDCWHDSYLGAPSDGAAWTVESKNDGRKLRRVLRGGSWFSYAKDARTAARYKYLPGTRLGIIGFRLART